ncbi:Transposase [Cordylochernes scorpioides]|uniref:Transposase n=1 Tax=Cordylochernes scorpioides TaxID=51811 RepID=A0ABY6K444_9ARAC|nr:Transposase [Cordylochernes scorpioides]
MELLYSRQHRTQQQYPGSYIDSPQKGSIDGAPILQAAQNPTTVSRSDTCPVATESTLHSNSPVGGHLSLKDTLALQLGVALYRRFYCSNSPGGSTVATPGRFYCSNSPGGSTVATLRRFLVENILTGDSEALKIKLDVLQTSRLCKKAWDQVTSETIKHCFKKAGFVKKEEDEENADDIIAETMPSVDGWEDVISNPTISYDDFLNVDDDVAVCGEITDADIIAEVLNHNIEKQDGEEASGDGDESSVAGVTSARVDRRILRQAAPQATCTAILQHVQDTLDHSISTKTISRRLVANGLHSCRPLRRLPLTPPNRRQRLEWCRARSTWMTEWHRVVFSDESRFCLSSDSRRVRVWRRRGERSNPAAIVERPTVRQRGIMVWGAIAYDSRSPLLRIQGTMMAQRYVDDVLRPVTLPYLQGVPNALYQQDNARPHTARISQQALQDVQMLPWPPYSPDLSPIEHVWDIIGRRLHALPQPRSEDELWQMVEREWRAIPQDAIRTLIDSLPRRVAACIAVRGGRTCY